MSKVINKAVAMMLTIMILSANFIIIGSYASEVLASGAPLESQTTKTNHENVEFNVYFKGGKHSLTSDITSKEVKIYLNVKVKNVGYLKNVQLDLSQANFKIERPQENNAVIQEIDTQKNLVILNQINSDSDIIVELPITPIYADKVNMNLFSKDSNILLTGNYVNENGKTSQIEKKIDVHMEWNGNVNAQLSETVTKYIPYMINGKRELMLQTTIHSGIENSILPIKDTEIVAKVPMIHNMKPEKVLVSSNQTTATNGKTDGTEFNEQNWNYDADQNLVTIKQENKTDKEGNISWIKNTTDEYVITYIYSQEVLDTIGDQGIEIALKAQTKMNVYPTTTKAIQKEFSEVIVLKDQIDNIVNFTVEPFQNSISKGFMYTNKEGKEKERRETLYGIRYTAQVGYAQITDSIKLFQNGDEFIADEAVSPTTVAGINYTYNKKISIKQNEFNKILGTEGMITFSNVEGAVLFVINKDTKTDENGNLVFDCSEMNINHVIIETSKPQTEGNISFEIQKAIKQKVDYAKSQIETFKNLRTNFIGTAMNAQTAMMEQNVAKNIVLEEPSSKAEVFISNQNLSTIIKNENIEIKAVLQTGSAQDALYKNPKILIELPEYVQQIDVKDIKILYDEELKIESSRIIDNGTNKIIEIQLNGIQTKYNADEVAKGTNILVNADIIANKLTPSKDAELKMYYTNANTKLFENKAGENLGFAETQLKFVAPVGMVTANTVKDYSSKGMNITAVNNEAKTAVLDIYQTGKIATVEGQIINNIGNDATDVVTLGRIAGKGQTQIDGQADLGNTIDTILKGAITTTGIAAENVMIYYSTNASASKDLNNSANRWTTTVSDYSTIKSYMIVLNNYTMKTGETLNFSYMIGIPDNLPHNQKASTNYKVYYNNNSSVGIMEESITAPMIELTTGQGPEIEAKVFSSIAENSVVRRGQYITMQVTIKNTGKVDANNVKIKITAPEGTLHTTYIDEERKYETSLEKDKILSIDQIKVGESKTISYMLKLKEYDDSKEEVSEDHDITGTPTTGITEIKNQVTVTADDLDAQIASNSYTLKVEDGYFSIENIPSITESLPVKSGDKIVYTVKISNITDKDLQNVIVSEKFANGIKVVKANTQESLIGLETSTEGIQYDDKNNTLTLTLNKLEARNVIYLVIEVDVQENAEGKISSVVEAKADGVDTHYSNELIHTAQKVKLTMEGITPDNQYIKEGTQFTYQYKITNTGNVSAFDSVIETQIPEGIKFIEARYVENGKTSVTTVLDDGKLIIKPYEIASGTSLTVTITAKANKLPNKDEKTITTFGTLEAKGFSKVQSNSIKFIIEYDAGNHSGDEEDPTEQDKNRYKITGTAWIDENKNGKREENEKLLSGIQVLLLNKSNSQIVLDLDNGSEKNAITNDDGTYEFNNLAPGEYLVAFLYDVNAYDLTEYDATGVSESLNSDAINMEINYNEKIQKAGVTNTLTISNSNIRNIDIGLVLSEKFDLRLDKYISKITVQNPKSPKTYTYENAKLAKVEILRGNIPSSTVIIEYKIVVSNDGAIPGYAKKVVDYLSKDLKFSSELNKGWYSSEDGNLYNASMANMIINPGESKEITLVLSKKMDLENTGVVNNRAEIFEAYNNKGTADINSTPGNQDTKENDWSSADVVISLSTGEIITYTGLTLGVIAIFGLGIYGIKKHVIGKKEN